MASRVAPVQDEATLHSSKSSAQDGIKEAFPALASLGGSAAPSSTASASVASAAAAAASHHGGRELGPRPPSFPPKVRQAGPTALPVGLSKPDAREGLKNASRAMADLATPPSIRPPASAQVIGAPSITPHQTMRATTRQEAEKYFTMIGGGSSFSKFGFLGAVASMPQVSDFVIGDLGREVDVAKLEHAGRIFQTIGYGKQRIGYIDVSTYFGSDIVLHRIWDRLRKGADRVTKVAFLEALDKDRTLSSLLLPTSVTEDEEAAVMSGEKTMASRLIFSKMSSNQEELTFDEFSKRIRAGAELQNLFSLIDAEDAGTVNKMEFLGSVAARPRVAAVILMDLSMGFDTRSNTAIQAADAVFNKISDGRVQVTLDDFTKYLLLESTMTAPNQETARVGFVDQLALLPGSIEGETSDHRLTPWQEENTAMLAAHRSSGRSEGPLRVSVRSQRSKLSSQSTIESYDGVTLLESLQACLAKPVQLLQQRLRPPDHPLEGDSIKLADLEAKISIWGRDVGEEQPTVYEDAYLNFAYFCTVVCLVQFFMYVGDVGWANVKYDGPPSGPTSLWMYVYDESCTDEREEVWRLWTYQWAHCSLAHVIGNCFAILFIGGMLEAVHGTRAVAGLYTMGVLSGAFTMGSLMPHDRIIGSGGGVYALVGARVMNLVLNKEHMPRSFWFRTILLLAWICWDTVSFTTTYKDFTSYGAHLGGWICGLLLGAYWLESFRDRPCERKTTIWGRRIFCVYLAFCLVWYGTQESGAPQGLFESKGHCKYAT